MRPNNEIFTEWVQAMIDGNVDTFQFHLDFDRGDNIHFIIH